MKKIGLITLFRDNYGSALQCYATKTILLSLGYECIVIERKDEPNVIKRRVKKTIDLLLTTLRHPDYFKIYFMIRKSSKKEIGYLTSDSSSAIDSFIQNEICPTRLNDIELKILGYSEEYYKFIVGSDQIWNPSRKLDPYFFLNFAPKNKRIAFAPSFGVSVIPKYNVKNIKKGISGFDYVSTREESGQNIIKKLCDVDVPCIADPTLLLSKGEWVDFASGHLKREKYYFIHFLNSPSDLAIKCINAMPKDIKRICFAYKHDNFDQIENAVFVDGDPRDYVGLIFNSAFTFTDSFHTTLFSLNLQKEFLTFERQYIHAYSQGSRIENILSRYSVTNRYIKKYKQFKDIKDEKLEIIGLDEDRRKQIEYLSNALK